MHIMESKKPGFTFSIELRTKFVWSLRLKHQNDANDILVFLLLTLNKKMLAGNVWGGYGLELLPDFMFYGSVKTWECLSEIVILNQSIIIDTKIIFKAGFF